MSTVAALRQKIGDRLNFRLTGSVTSAATAQTTEAFVDATNQEEDDVLANSWCLFTSGANTGIFRQIAGNQDGYVSFKKAWPNPMATADTYEVYRRFSPSQILNGINYALRTSFPYLYTHMEVEVPEDPTTTEYAMPANMVELRQLRRRVNPQTVSGTGSQLIGVAMSLSSALARATVYTQIQVTGNQIANIGAGQIFQLDYGYGDAQTVVLTPGQSITFGSGVTTIPVVSPTSGSVLISQGGTTTAFQSAVDFPIGTPVQTLSTAATPPVYVDLRGSDWEPQSERVRIFYRPAAGQFLLFVGMGANQELALDTDSTNFPDELVIAGAAQFLYEQLLVGESGSSSPFFVKQAKKFEDYFTELKRRYAMQTIPFETHPPRIRVVRGWVTDIGPINP